jgi:hypothetical protein
MKIKKGTDTGNRDSNPAKGLLLYIEFIYNMPIMLTAKNKYLIKRYVSVVDFEYKSGIEKKRFIVSNAMNFFFVKDNLSIIS